MISKFIFLLFMPFLSIVFHKIYLLEVEPSDFTCQHRKQIKADSKMVFELLTTSVGIEKLLPWLTRFREADMRIIAPGKSYMAYMKYPVIGEKRVYAKLTEYKFSKLLTFEFEDLLEHTVRIQTNSYHDRTLLQTTIYSRRSSLIYQYTIGYVMRLLVKDQLEKSMKNVAILFENLNGPYNIPKFSKSN